MFRKITEVGQGYIYGTVRGVVSARERLAAKAQVLASLFMQDHFVFTSAADR